MKDSQPRGLRYRPAAAVDAELVVDIFRVTSDGFDGDEELGGDFPGGQWAGEQGKNLLLARGEGIEQAR